MNEQDQMISNERNAPNRQGQSQGLGVGERVTFTLSQLRGVVGAVRAVDGETATVEVERGCYFRCKQDLIKRI